LVTAGLDRLLESRFHGAVNIRGIRYQILYSVLRSIEFYELGGDIAVRLEGIEDVDVIGLGAGDEYVQVKTANEPWSWSDLKRPLRGFAEAMRAGSDATFRLVLDFQPRTDLERLASFKSLRRSEQKRIREKFRRLCKERRELDLTGAEADQLLDRLVIESLSEDLIVTRLHARVTEAFDLGSGVVDIYVHVLLSHFFEWAKDRHTVTRVDVDAVRLKVGEGFARQEAFEAYGRGLIERVAWGIDASADDFYEGKGTRPGHVASELDVPRPFWQAQIDVALATGAVCVIRSSSGQGKSTLALRYARDRWLPESIFALHVAETEEHVELIHQYLRFRSGLGLPTLLLIDNASWNTQLWPQVAQECAALGIRAVITTRTEDWYRFSRQGLTNFEIVEPALDLSEATEIFRVLQEQDKIHEGVESPAWAFEQIGEPRLLMEYIYLITHGRMLRDRLEDQVKEMRKRHEDPGKIELLRRIAVADTLGVPISTMRLISDVNFSGDPQDALLSLHDEYARLANEQITGLHRVRSQHLVTILHDGYMDPANTALKVLDAIALSNVPTLVANAMTGDDMDVDVFTVGLVDRAVNGRLDQVLAYLEGVFVSGERQFFQLHRAKFDEAYEHLGPSGPQVMSGDLLPMTALHTVRGLLNRLDHGNATPGLVLVDRLIQDVRATREDRGLDLCQSFLKQIAHAAVHLCAKGNVAEVGQFLDWMAICGARLPAGVDTRNLIPQADALLGLPVTDLCTVMQGLYRYDADEYRQLFQSRRDDVLGYLRLHLECVALDVSNETVSFEFLPDPDSGEDVHDQAVRRAHSLRSALPFASHYQSRQVWAHVRGLAPSVDAARLDMSIDNLHFRSDVSKNASWKSLAESAYLPDSYYRYQKAWHQIRTDALTVVRGVNRSLRRLVAGRDPDLERSFDDIYVIDELRRELLFRPLPPHQTSEPVKKDLNEGTRGTQNLLNFVNQLLVYIEEPTDRQTGRLAVHNFQQVVAGLSDMHSAFDELFSTAGDYHDMKLLNRQELEWYPRLANVLESWILEPPMGPVEDIDSYVEACRRERFRQRLADLGRAAEDLRTQGVNVLVPSSLPEIEGLRVAAIAFLVDDPTRPMDPLPILLEVLSQVDDVAHMYYLIPIHAGVRILDGAYRFTSVSLDALAEGETPAWESFTVQPVPDAALVTLPPFEMRSSERLQALTQVAGIINDLVWAAEIAVRLSRLAESDSYFDTQLRDRLISRLQRFDPLVRREAEQALESLSRCVPPQTRTSEYSALVDFLDTVLTVSRQGRLLFSPPNAAEASDILDVAQRILETAHES